MLQLILISKAHRFAPSLLAAAALAFAPAAQAAHPLLTDDAGTLGRGAWQLELCAEGSRDAVGPAAAREREHAAQAGVALGLGIRDDLDLSAAIGGLWSRTERDASAPDERRGLGDTTLALKWRALSRGGFAVALRPALVLPTGDAGRGLGTGGGGYGLTLVATQELGDQRRFALHVNAAWIHERYSRREDRAASRADRFRTSMAATARVAPAALLVADVGAETHPERAVSTWPAYGLAGVVFNARADLDLDVGVKLGLTAPAPDVTGLFGVTYRF